MKYVNIIDFQTRAQSIKCLLFNREELPRPAYQYLHTNQGLVLQGCVPSTREVKTKKLPDVLWPVESVSSRFSERLVSITMGDCAKGQSVPTFGQHRTVLKSTSMCMWIHSTHARTHTHTHTHTHI